MLQSLATVNLINFKKGKIGLGQFTFRPFYVCCTLRYCALLRKSNVVCLLFSSKTGRSTKRAWCPRALDKLCLLPCIAREFGRWKSLSGREQFEVARTRELRIAFTIRPLRRPQIINVSERLLTRELGRMTTRGRSVSPHIYSRF